MQPVLYRRINELLDSYRTQPASSKDIWVKRLFKTLDWGANPTYSISNDGNGYKLLVDNFPMVNVIAESPDNRQKVYAALNKAYNQDVPWIVATDFRSLEIFGSYWMSFEHDTTGASALRIESENYLTESHHLELLTPESVAGNRLDEYYTAYKTRPLRLPIDVHLVQRMAQWRHLGLQAIGGESVEADFLVHRIINSLFLIRYIEDRGTSQDSTLLQIAKDRDESEFIGGITLLLKGLEKHTGYKVPTKSELSKLGHRPLRKLIEQLYGYPDWGIRYDFSDLSVDILGRFYEEYLRKKVAEPISEPVDLSLFPDRSFELKDVRKKYGVYYTPRFIVDYVLNSLLQRFKASSSSSIPVIADLSCGSGTFLSAAIDQVFKIYPRARMQIDNVVESIIGFDNDPRATEAAKLNVSARLISHGFNATLPQLRISCFDIISEGPAKTGLTNIVDIVVGNPPYRNYEELSRSYSVSKISKMFTTADGRVDSYILFVESALRLVKEGGFVGLVLPNAVLRTKTAGALRELLSGQADLLEIIDFQHQPVFPGVGAYVCLLLFRKRIPNTQSPRVVVTKIHALSKTPTTQLASATASNTKEEGVEVFQIDQPSGNSAWLLKNVVETSLTERIIAESDETAGNVLELRQGIKSGKDEALTFEFDEFKTKRYVLTFRGRQYSIEKEIVIPILRNRDLTRWGSQATTMLIYPYDKKSKQLIMWKQLQESFPGTAEYLRARKEELASRRSLRGKKWYSLIEPRLNTVMSRGPFLIAAEIGLRPTICRPEPLNASIIGNFWLHLLSESYDLDVLMAYLNSIVAELYLREQASILRGGYILLRGVNFLKLPLPRFLKNPESFAFGELKRLSQNLSQKVLERKGIFPPSFRADISRIEDQIDTITMQALNLTNEQAEYVRSKVITARGAFVSNEI